MDIGTAKPDPATRRRVPHHMIDLVDPADDFTAAEFQTRGRRTLADLRKRGVRAILAGGSGLHFRALVDPMSFAPRDDDVKEQLEASSHDELVQELTAADPAASAHVDLANPRRVMRSVEVLRAAGVTPSERAYTAEHDALLRYEPLLPVVALGVDPGDALALRVDTRLAGMLAAGLLAEVAGLRSRMGRTASQAVGYKELMPVVEGRLELGDGVAATRAATLALAKRQRTYFRRDPRIRWIPWHHDASVRIDRAGAVLEQETGWSS